MAAETTITRRKNRSNLNSLAAIGTRPTPADLIGWAINEAAVVEDEVHRNVVISTIRHVELFARWPQEPLLLWEGATRQTKYHRYPSTIKDAAVGSSIRLDGRVNGPAIAAFLLAKGERPFRFGKINRWNIHHIYSGKFPFLGKKETLHAAQEPKHMTQSAGLVAVHPVLDALVDEYPFMSWMLRTMSFVKFGYDPDGVFEAGEADEYGFVLGFETRILQRDSGLPHPSRHASRAPQDEAS